MNRVGLMVGQKVGVGVPAGMGVSVGSGVGVRVGVRDDVAVWVRLGVHVWEGVKVSVAVQTAGKEGRSVGVRVGRVKVGVAGSVGSDNTLRVGTITCASSCDWR